LKRLSVLVVDDEPALCEILQDLLDMEGYEVTARHDFESAVEALSTGSFDLAMFDVFLSSSPVGLDLARLVLSDYPSTEVVIMTGFADQGDIQSACLSGAYTCIDKPFDLDDVVRVVGMALSEKSPPECASRSD